MAINNAINAQQSGFQSQSSSGVWNGRTLTAGTGINITNGDGVSGNPTITNTGGGGGGGSGAFVQQVRTTSTSAITSTKTLASTGTTPTTSNTDSIITLAITPTNASNILIIDFKTQIGCDFAETVHTLIFQGTTFITGFPKKDSLQQNIFINYRYYLVAGTTSSTTFDIRFASTGGTTIKTLQTKTGTAWLNGAGNTSTELMITEVTV